MTVPPPESKTGGRERIPGTAEKAKKKGRVFHLAVGSKKRGGAAVQIETN